MYNYQQQKALAQQLGGFQPPANSGLGGAFAQALAGFGGGYLGGKANQYENQQRQQLAQLLSSGNNDGVMNFLASSQIPEYQNMGLKSKMDTMQENTKAQRLAEALGKGDVASLASVPGALDMAVKIKDLNKGNEMTPYQQAMVGLKERELSGRGAAKPIKVWDNKANQYKFANEADLSNNPDYLPPEAGSNPQKLGKVLPPKAIGDLTIKADLRDTIERLNTTFRPEYAGNVINILGRAENLLGRVGIGDGNQSQWWQDYDGWANEIRHSLFGSALTKTEQDAFERAMIAPGMEPEQVNTNLSRQAAIIDKGVNRLANTYRAGGYNPEMIDEATGRMPIQQPTNIPEELQQMGITPDDIEEFKREMGM